QGYERLVTRIDETLAGAPPSDGRAELQVLGLCYVEFALADPQRFRLMWQMESIDAAEPALAAGGGRACEGLVRGGGRGVSGELVDRGERGTTSGAAWSLVHGLAELWATGRLRHRAGSVEPIDLARTVTRLFVDRVVVRSVAQAPSGTG